MDKTGIESCAKEKGFVDQGNNIYTHNKHSVRISQNESGRNKIVFAKGSSEEIEFALCVIQEWNYLLISGEANFILQSVNSIIKNHDNSNLRQVTFRFSDKNEFDEDEEGPSPACKPHVEEEEEDTLSP